MLDHLGAVCVASVRIVVNEASDAGILGNCLTADLWVDGLVLPLSCGLDIQTLTFEIVHSSDGLYIGVANLLLSHMCSGSWGL